MFKETLTYQSFDGETVTKEFYFNLGKADLIRLETDIEGGLNALIQRITAKTATGREIMDTLEEVVRRAYGVRVGDAFIHREEDWQQFRYGPAWDEFFTKMFTDPGYSAAFVNGAVPANLAQQLAEQGGVARVSEQTAQRMDQAARQDPAERYVVRDGEPFLGDKDEDMRLRREALRAVQESEGNITRPQADPQAEQMFYGRPPHEG